MKREALFLMAVVGAQTASAAELAAADEPVTHTLALEAQVPVVTVPPQSADRHFLNLPNLEFRFAIEARCHVGWDAESVTVNVADSRLSLAGTQLNNASEAGALLRIPAKQIAPIAIADFCVIGAGAEGSGSGVPAAAEPGPGTGRVTINGVLSAHAALICRAEDARATTYVTEPLTVTLECAEGTADS